METDLSKVIGQELETAGHLFYLTVGEERVRLSFPWVLSKCKSR